jgi:hypothetical protein
MSDKKYKGPLPKSKPTKLERLLNKRVKGEKGPYKPKIGDLNEMGPIVTDTKTGEIVSGFKDGGAVRGKVKGYEEGGNVISDADAKRLRKTLPYVPGKTISDADAKRLRKTLPYAPGKSTSDADLEKLKKLMKPLKYEDGGAVRGMGAAYQGKSRTCKVR